MAVLPNDEARPVFPVLTIRCDILFGKVSKYASSKRRVTDPKPQNTCKPRFPGSADVKEDCTHNGGHECQVPHWAYAGRKTVTRSEDFVIDLRGCDWTSYDSDRMARFTPQVVVV